MIEPIHNMQKTALITGASKGIGLELSKIFAENGCNLILIARNEVELARIKTKFEEIYAIRVTVIVKDLSVVNAAKEVFDSVKESGLSVDYLINNAGIGIYGEFISSNWARNKAMLDINITALTEFCYLFLNEWKTRRNGKIMNIASTAAFQPGPMMAVYFATKSYVFHFSEAIGREMKKTGISVTAFCPSPTKTYFMEDSNMKQSGMVKGKKLPEPREVALSAYNAMMNGKPVVIQGLKNKLIAFGVCLSPRKWVVNLSEKLMK